MQKGDEVEIFYTTPVAPGMGYDAGHEKKYAGRRGTFVEKMTNMRASHVNVMGAVVAFWDFDLRPAAPLSPFGAKVRAYIDKELR